MPPQHFPLGLACQPVILSALVHDLNSAWTKFGQRSARNREDVGINRHARKKHRGRRLSVDENQRRGGKV